jgi:hypothetical protein
MQMLGKLGLAIFVVWLLANIHVFLVFRTSLLMFLIFVVVGLIVIGLATKKPVKSEGN